jgi:MFS family permease
MHRLFRLDLAKPDDRNAWFLIIEMFWASMLASAATFNAAFALRLGATNSEVGLLTSIPALMAVLVSLPAGRFLNTKVRRKPWILGSLVTYRAVYLLIALLPFIKLPETTLAAVFIGLVVSFSSVANFFNVGWIPLLSDVVPPQNRAAVFSARNIIYNSSMSICGFLFGLWLEKILFPINYQIMYAFGFATSLLSFYFLLKVQVPDSIVKPRSQETTKKTNPWGLHRLSQTWIELKQVLLTHKGFVRITSNTLLHGIGIWMVGPLYILHYVRNLGATEGWLGLNGTILTTATILGFAFWRWLMVRWGEPFTLKRTILWVGFYPILVGLLPTLPLILIATAINGLMVPGVNLSHFNTLLKVTPEENRPGYTAAYMTIANLGAFICPLVGVALADQFGIAPTMIGCGILCILGSTSFWIWPVRSEQNQSNNGLQKEGA